MKRISQLDGIRGLAILLVLLWHYGGCEFDGPGGTFPWYANIALRLTWSGVDLFFVLSGFLIAKILLDHQRSGNYFRIFYLRRVCRIVPLYFCVVAAFVIAQRTAFAGSPSASWLFQNAMPDWSYATFTQNILMAIRGTLGANAIDATWSLAVEEQFYLVIPFLIYFLPRRALAAVFCAAIVAAPILRWVYPGVCAFVGTPWRSDALLSGALLALLVRSHSFIELARRHHRLLWQLFLVLLAGAALLTLHPPLLQGDAFTHLWLAGLFACLLLIAFMDLKPIVTNVLRWRVLVWLGQLSYGIYLFHKPASGLVYALWRGTAPVIRTLNDVPPTLVALAASLLLASLSYRFFEGPIIRFGHRFLYQPASEITDRVEKPLPAGPG